MGDHIAAALLGMIDKPGWSILHIFREKNGLADAVAKVARRAGAGSAMPPFLVCVGIPSGLMLKLHCFLHFVFVGGSLPCFGSYGPA